MKAGLEASGCTVALVASDAADLTARVREIDAEVVVCDLDDPSRDALESMRALHRDAPRPVVVFAARGEPDQIEAALEAGVAAYVVEGLAPARVRPVIEVAIRRFRAHQAMRDELARARATLADRTVVERAKGVLMRRRRLSEAEAHRALQRMAMDRGKRLSDMAEMLLHEEEAGKARS
ncbi:ANTAR domain-containing protein [Roseomonas sp. NAR14]|uniref:ANTAR domain-containing protein n=1 Tax=Roseomonas acroporae TaxID=2937791 RepID=A0A9X1Y6K2_9PROT|nr:ANTAR domain-containing protein [Roseomonas acroporae]